MNAEPPDDASLLRQYAGGSEPAFRELVQRHLGMVQATARRMLTSTPHLADDVTQAAFTDLAKKASTLPAGTVLGGWLHRHTCYLALNAARTENRRRTRERTAMEIHALDDNPGAEAQWLQLAPVLDDALTQLDAEDRDALVLRYLEQRDLRSIGRALGTSEDTAQKRVARALEKLRGLLTRRGVAVASAGALSSTLEANVVATTPAGLAAAVSATAVNAAATSTLVTFKTMITSKWAVGAAAIIAAGVIITVIVSQNGSTTSPAATSVPAAKAPVGAQTAMAKPTSTTASAKIEVPQAAPARGDGPAVPALTDDEPDPFAPVNPTQIFVFEKFPPSPEELPAAPPAAVAQAPVAATLAAPAASQAATYGSYGDGSKRMLTVTDGELTMSIVYANGTVSTTPYKEAGATVTITAGDKPNTYVLTFRNESTGRINMILTGVPTSADYIAAGGNTTGK